MTGVASPEKATGSKKKSERKCAAKEEYRQLSGIMGVMNNLRKQVCDKGKSKQNGHVGNVMHVGVCLIVVMLYNCACVCVCLRVLSVM